MSSGKLTEKIYDVFNYFLGAKTGFMPIVCILTAMFYSSISGSATAVTAAVGGMCLPLLIEMGYDNAFCTSILMCVGVLGFLIPPSTPLTVVIGLADLDLTTGYYGGEVLGIAIGLMLIVYAYLYCLINGNGDPKIIMSPHNAIRSSGIFSGLFTAAQAAMVSVVYGAIVSVMIYKTLTWKQCIDTIKEGLEVAVPLLVVLFAANILSPCLEALNAVAFIAGLIEKSGAGAQLVTFMDLGTACYMLVPIVLPVAFRLGVEPYHPLVGMVRIQNIGFVTPPVGLALLVMNCEDLSC